MGESLMNFTVSNLTVKFPPKVYTTIISTYRTWTGGKGLTKNILDKPI